MSDGEKVSSSPAASKPRTPAYANFDSNTDKLNHILTIMRRGIKGIAQEFTEDLRKVGVADDVNGTGPLRDIDSAVEAVERVGAHFSGLIVMIEWIPVMIVTTVEAHLMDVLAYAAEIDPTLMERSEQSISYSELTSPNFS
jgi:hypothetical protein